MQNPSPADADSQSRSNVRRYLYWEQGVLSIPVNMAINAAIAWLIYGGMESVPLKGRDSITSDIHGTCLLLPFIANGVVTAITYRKMSRGQLPRISRRWFTGPPWRDTFSRGFLLAVICWPLFAPATILLLSRLGIEHLSLSVFLVFKSLYAAGLGLLVCPLCGWLALGDEVEQRPPKAE